MAITKITIADDDLGGLSILIENPDFRNMKLRNVSIVDRSELLIEMLPSKKEEDDEHGTSE